MATKLKNGETILFVGDSITDCGRREPGMAPLGCGYVRMVADMLTIREPQKKVRVLNRGVGGDTVANLRSRWEDDVLAERPDWLSIKIGINDLNQTLAGQSDLPSAKYAEIYDELLAETRRRLPACRILLIDPFFVSRDRAKDSYRCRVLRLVEDYIAGVHALSRKHKTRLVRTHELFKKQLKHHTLSVFGDEPVHPNSAGHLLIAEAVYKALQ